MTFAFALRQSQAKVLNLSVCFCDFAVLKLRSMVRLRAIERARVLIKFPMFCEVLFYEYNSFNFGNTLVLVLLFLLLLVLVLVLVLLLVLVLVLNIKNINFDL